MYTTDKGAQDAYIQAAQKRSYKVIELDGPIDSHFIGHLEQKEEKLTVKRVDSDTLDKLIDKDEVKASVLSEDEEKKVKEIFEQVVGDTKTHNVSIEALSTDELPVSITLPEFMRRMKEMQMAGGGGMAMMGDMPDTYNVVVNGNHELVQKILQADDSTQKELAKQGFDLALLSQGLLKGAGLTGFIERSVKLATEKA